MTLSERNIKLKDNYLKKTILYLGLIFVFQSYNCGNINKNLDKMKSNPKALFHGGPDGGYYFEIIEKKDEKFRMKIYLDYNEELMLDGYFKSTNDSCGNNLTLENIQNCISTYDDDIIYINDPNKKKFCKLILVETIYDIYKK